MGYKGLGGPLCQHGVPLPLSPPSTVWRPLSFSRDLSLISSLRTFSLLLPLRPAVREGVRPLGYHLQRPGTAAARRRQQEQQQQLLEQLMKGPAAASASPVKKGISFPFSNSSEDTKAPSALGSSQRLPRGQRGKGGPGGLHGPPNLSQSAECWGIGGSSGDREARLLVAAATEAAKAGAGTPAYWKAVGRRAVDLAALLTAADVAALLHALNRASRMTGEETILVLQDLMPRIEALLPSFTSLQIAQVLSALSRVEMVEPSLLQGARSSISRLLGAGGFDKPFELAMILKASIKLGLLDPPLLAGLNGRTQQLLERGQFPIRDLAVVAQAFASVSLVPRDLLDALADVALSRLAEATALDLARLLQAFASTTEWSGEETAAGSAPGAAADDRPSHNECSMVSNHQAASISARRRLFSACIEAAGDRILFSSPAELTVAAQAFGLALVESHGPEGKALASLLQRIRSVAITSLGLFLPQQLASLLLTFARWRLPFSPADLLKVIERLLQLSKVAKGTDGDRLRNRSGGDTAFGDMGCHPLFCSSLSMAPLNSTCRISCLYSLGVLLRPCAAAVAATNGHSCQREGVSRTIPEKETANSLKETASSVALSEISSAAANSPHMSSRSSKTDTETRFARRQLAAADEAAEALKAAECLFHQWIEGIFFDLSRRSRCSQETEETSSPQNHTSSTEGGLQPVIKLAEALANCSYFAGAQAVLGPLQQLVLQRHRDIDSTSASKLVYLFRIIGLPEDHDLFLLLQERTEQTLGPSALGLKAPATVRRDEGFRGLPLTIRGPAALVQPTE